MASELLDYLNDELNDDFCYHAEVDDFLRAINWEKIEKEKPEGVDLAAINYSSPIIQPTDDQIRNALREILESGKIEIGETAMETPDYMTFVAWSRSVEERVERALKSVNECNERDRKFVYWLCRKDRVDRYEAAK